MLASFFLLACARLALRLAQLLCVRPRPVFPASLFASSASRSAKLEDISTDRRPEHEARERGNFSAPRLGSSAGCYPLWLPGKRGTPLAPGGLGRRRLQPPSTSAGQQLRGASSTQKERTGPRAHTARIRRISRARTRRASGASHGAHTAHLAARNRRVLRRATGASLGALNGASLKAQPVRLPKRRLARLPARSRHASTACEVFAF